MVIILGMRTDVNRTVLLFLVAMLVAGCGGGADEVTGPVPTTTSKAEAILESLAEPTQATARTPEVTLTPEPIPVPVQESTESTEAATTIEATSTASPGPSHTPLHTATSTATPVSTVSPGGGQTPSSTLTPTVTPALDVPATRLALHLFIPVGESRSLAGLGRLLETEFLTEPAAVRIEGDSIIATAHGIACLRFEYRDAEAENTVQTLCSVSFDETGDCSGLLALDLDLNRFLEQTNEPVGNANLLESGSGLLYRACKTGTGAYRLQQPDQPLPNLYFTIIDALGSGPYSLGSTEFDIQRAGTVTTYSGTELVPQWVLSVSLEINDVGITEDLEVAFTWEDCSFSPGCTPNPAVVRSGDVIRVSIGIPSELLDEDFESMSEAIRDRFFSDRIGMGWAEIAEVHPDARRAAFNRIALLDMVTDAVRYFDGIYDLTGKGVAVGYRQPWQAQSSLAFPHECYPDDIVPEETERCNRIDEAIQALEVSRIGELREDGLTLWYAGSIDYGDEGQYAPVESRRPHFASFHGMVVSIGANSGIQVENIPNTLANVASQFASEVGSEIPVILSLNGPPITAQTGRAFCEAQICPSDFEGMYEQAEAVLESALRSFAGDQLVGFGISLFEGSHFDIREPYEEFGGFSLNRVGETGYNNPILNVYRAMPDPMPKVAIVSPRGEPGTPSSVVDDAGDCGNSVGNGNEVISGPSAPEANDRDSVFRSLAVHPTDPDVILMGTEKNGFVKSVDGGVTWTRYRRGLRWQPGIGYPEVYDISISPSDPNMVLAATVNSPGPVIGNFPSSTAGVYMSSDGGETWTRKNCGLTNSRIVAVRFDPANSERAIITVGAGERSFSSDTELPLFFEGGIFITDDGGDNWRRSADNEVVLFSSVAPASRIGSRG